MRPQSITPAVLERICERCGRSFLVWRSSLKLNPDRFCSTSCRSVPVEVRFRSLIGPTDARGCLPWQGKCDKDGYGVLTSQPLATAMGVKHKKLRAHRIAYYFHLRVNPGKLEVCHRCDNPPCVNPAHLFLGTMAINHADKVAKVRHPSGLTHYNHRLTAEQVLEIRGRYSSGSSTQNELAAEFGVTQVNISKIITRKSWNLI